MKRHIVTGGAGFIGSTLVRTLLNQEDGEVEVIDSLLTGYEHNLEEVRDRIKFHRLDIRDARVARAGDSRRGYGLPFGGDSIGAALDCRSGALPRSKHRWHLQRISRRGDGRRGRVVYAASSSAYGDSETLPKVESMVPRPKSPYAVQKLVGEQYASVFHSCFGLETVALRFFNVYGPRQDPTSAYSGVLSLFMKHLLARTTPTIFGDGEQSRDFTYVEDVAALCLKASRAAGRRRARCTTPATAAVSR